MSKRTLGSAWRKAWQKTVNRAARQVLRAVVPAAKKALKPVSVKSRTSAGTSAGTSARPTAGQGRWITGTAAGPGGARIFQLFKPPGVLRGERLPVLVMLHGCGQDVDGFARSTRMNRIAVRERFLVLYPEQSRIANPHRCWNWFETESGRAQAEAALIVQAVDQACLLHGADGARVAVAGLSAGGSMAALLGAMHPSRFRAVAMHSGVAPGHAHNTLSAIRAMQGRATRTAAQGLTSSTAHPLPPLMVIHGKGDRVVMPDNGHAGALEWANALGATPPLV
ncbi:MAG: PHB depolymerase family esterase, partial [Burkholderiaceae bacterium]